MLLFTGRVTHFDASSALIFLFLQKKLKSWNPVQSKNNWDMDVTKINDMERTAMSLSLIEACKYGTADCLVKASEKFTAFDTTTNANELDRDQKLAGYCYGIQEGSADQWDALWKLYEREQNANEKSTLTYGLACSKDTAILKVNF